MSHYEEVPLTDREDTLTRHVTGAGAERRLVFLIAATGQPGFQDLSATLLTDGRVLVTLPPVAVALGRIVLDVGFFAVVAEQFDPKGTKR